MIHKIKSPTQPGPLGEASNFRPGRIRQCSKLAIFIALFLFNYSMFAQAEPPPLNQPALSSNNASNPYETTTQGNRWTISVDYSYVGAGGISFQGIKGNSDAQSVNASVRGEIPLGSKWFVPVGIGSRNLFLGTIAGAPIPDQINTLAFNTGVGYHCNDQWTFAGRVGPRLYRVDNVNGNDVGITGVVMAIYKWKPNLMIALGIAFDPDNQVPVLPAAGLRWDIRPELTLNLMFPKPEIIYRWNPKLSLFVCGDLNFATFRADQNLGDKIGQPVFNNALGTYRDFHIAGGAKYQILGALSISIEGGYSVGREIDYTRINKTVSFDPSPYIQIGLKSSL